MDFIPKNGQYLDTRVNIVCYFVNMVQDILNLEANVVRDCLSMLMSLNTSYIHSISNTDALH